MDGLRPGWAVKAIIVIIITSILFRCVSATNHSVGGSIGWDLASDLRAWSASTTFHVGDSLVFAYTPLHDVLEVNESDFDSCQISHPINAHRDGNTVIQLSQTGSRYFICGRLGHCDMGLKLQVQVLPQLSTNATHAGSDGNGNGNGNGTSRKRPPAPQGHESPAPPSNRSREKPDPSGQPSVPVPPAASPSKASVACHVEAAGSLITLLLIISSWPRETLRFMFTFLHLVI